MSSTVPIQFLINSLNNRTHVAVNEYPENPNHEVTYKIISHKLFNTTTGDLLLLELEKDNTIVTISLPDIQEVELNDMTSARHEKYYLHILNRIMDRDLKELEKAKTFRKLLDKEEEKYFELESNRTELLRVIVTTQD